MTRIRYDWDWLDDTYADEDRPAGDAPEPPPDEGMGAAQWVIVAVALIMAGLLAVMAGRLL